MLLIFKLSLCRHKRETILLLETQVWNKLLARSSIIGVINFMFTVTKIVIYTIKIKQVYFFFERNKTSILLNDHLIDKKFMWN